MDDAFGRCTENIENTLAQIALVGHLVDRLECPGNNGTRNVAVCYLQLLALEYTARH